MLIETMLIKYVTK